MDAVACSWGCSELKGQVVWALYARWAASRRTRTFLIRAHEEVSSHCFHANEESFYNAKHGRYTVQQNNVLSYATMQQHLLSLTLMESQPSVGCIHALNILGTFYACTLVVRFWVEWLCTYFIGYDKCHTYRQTVFLTQKTKKSAQSKFVFFHFPDVIFQHFVVSHNIFVSHFAKAVCWINEHHQNAWNHFKCCLSSSS